MLIDQYKFFNENLIKLIRFFFVKRSCPSDKPLVEFHVEFHLTK